jgi:hypothetical protein
MKSLELQEQLRNETHRKHLKQRKKIWNQKKALEKGDAETPKKKGKYGINIKVLRNEIVKTAPQNKEKNWFKRKPLRNEIAKTPKRKGKK